MHTGGAETVVFAHAAAFPFVSVEHSKLSMSDKSMIMFPLLKCPPTAPRLCVASKDKPLRGSCTGEGGGMGQNKGDGLAIPLHMSPLVGGISMEPDPVFTDVWPLVDTSTDSVSSECEDPCGVTMQPTTSSCWAPKLAFVCGHCCRSTWLRLWC